MPFTVSVADKVPRRPTRSRSPSVAFDEGSPVMHQSMRWPRSRNIGDLAHAIDGIALRPRSAAAPPCPHGPDARRRNFPARPRTPPRCPSCPPCHGRARMPSRTSGANGSLVRRRAAPAAPRRYGRAAPVPPSPLPCVAHRLSTSPEAQVFDGEAGALRWALRDQLLATSIVQRHRRPRDQVAGRGEDIAHLSIPNSFFEAVVRKSRATSRPAVVCPRRQACGSAADIPSAAASIRHRLPGALRFGGSRAKSSRTC